MSKKWLLYLIGKPGSGKTTLFDCLFKDIPTTIEKHGLLTITRYPVGTQLGYRRDAFGGTDALPMNVQPDALHWLSKTKELFVVAEGDRLSNNKFFNSLRDDGWRLSVAHLRCPEELAVQRRKQRGSNQNNTWLAGRRTKVERIASMWGSMQWQLDARLDVEDLSSHLSKHPVCQAIINSTCKRD